MNEQTLIDKFIDGLLSGLLIYLLAGLGFLFASIFIKKKPNKTNIIKKILIAWVLFLCVLYYFWS